MNHYALSPRDPLTPRERVLSLLGNKNADWMDEQVESFVGDTPDIIPNRGAVSYSLSAGIVLFETYPSYGAICANLSTAKKLYAALGRAIDRLSAGEGSPHV